MAEDSDHLRWNARCISLALKARGVEVTLLDPTAQLLLAEFGGRREYLLETDSSLFSYTAGTIANHKYLSKLLLQEAGLPVPAGRRFDRTQLGDALVYAQVLCGPVVLKPCTAGSGAGVHIGLQSLTEIELAFERILRKLGPTVEILVERQVTGYEFRIFIAADGRYAVVHRDPAHVIGNGADTIESLAEAETRRRTTPRRNCLAPIPLDDTVRRYLERSGRSLKDVPARGEKVYLRANSNVNAGGTAEDWTDRVHPSVIDLAARALKAVPGLPYVGVDFMTADVTVPQADVEHHLIELNTNPSIGLHQSPGKGVGRDVAEVMADLLFPDTRRRRLPEGPEAIPPTLIEEP